MRVPESVQKRGGRSLEVHTAERQRSGIFDGLAFGRQVLSVFFDK